MKLEVSDDPRWPRCRTARGGWAATGLVARCSRPRPVGRCLLSREGGAGFPARGLTCVSSAGTASYFTPVATTDASTRRFLSCEWGPTPIRAGSALRPFEDLRVVPSKVEGDRGSGRAQQRRSPRAPHRATAGAVAGQRHASAVHKAYSSGPPNLSARRSPGASLWRGGDGFRGHHVRPGGQADVSRRVPIWCRSTSWWWTRRAGRCAG